MLVLVATLVHHADLIRAQPQNDAAEGRTRYMHRKAARIQSAARLEMSMARNGLESVLYLR